VCCDWKEKQAALPEALNVPSPNSSIPQRQFEARFSDVMALISLMALAMAITPTGAKHADIFAVILSEHTTFPLFMAATTCHQNNCKNKNALIYRTHIHASYHVNNSRSGFICWLLKMLFKSFDTCTI
jgi:hypothetical protein